MTREISRRNLFLMEDSYTKLPFPPSVWKAYFRSGKMQFKTKEYKAFEGACMLALNRSSIKIPDSEEIEVNIVLFSNRWRNKDGSVKKKDLDNYLKCLIDVLSQFAKKSIKGFDDSRIFSLSAQKRDSREEFALVSLTSRNPRDY